MCSDVQVSRSSAAGAPPTVYKLFVPSQARVNVTASVDVLRGVNGSNYASIFHVDPIEYWMFGSDFLKPTFDNTHSKEWINWGPDRELTLSMWEAVSAGMN